MLNSLADFYDEEIETNLGRFVTIVEPALLVIMGIVIAGLLLSLYMPLFKLSSALVVDRQVAGSDRIDVIPVPALRRRNWCTGADELITSSA